MNETWWVGQDQLDEDQKDIIDLPLDSSFLITGPPGSGKTNLLLLRATFLAMAGQPNIAVVVFTHSLQDFISAGGSNYDFSAERIMTSRHFARQVLTDAGRVFSPPAGFTEQREYCIKSLEDFVLEEDPDPPFDAILIDEAQDYLPGEIELFCRLSKRIFAAADSRQKLYDGADSLETIRANVDEIRELTYHYRCGTKICKVADEIAVPWKSHIPMTPTSHYDEKSSPSRVERVMCHDEDKEFEALIEILKVQLQAYPDEWLGVVSPRLEEAEKFWQRLAQSDLSADAAWFRDKNLFSGERRIFVGTMHSAKGLEFRALHMIGIDYLRRFYSRQRFLAFTTVTRAKTSLSIYIQKTWPGFLEKAVRSVEPPPQLPSLEDVFGKKK